MLHVQPVAKDLLLFVVQHDAQNVIVDHALDLLGGAAKELLDIEDRTHFTADFIKKKQRVGLSVRAFVKPGIFDRDGQAAAEQRQNALLLWREVIEVIALNIEYANTFALNHQRHSQL